ncbi:amino acid adenylation domain-containing protein [Dokdonella soli]|uniref:Carrier domain-containing protein n=1 Tax=Dokdonella soli TaxID=529810 RepID=A0ABN1IPF4_9GAMM
MSTADIQSAASTAVDYDPFSTAPLARVVPSTEPQREIWLAAKLEPEASLAYNESVSLHLRGPLDANALRTALQALGDRHEALRATLSANGEDFCIAEHVDLPYAEHDLSALDPEVREAEVAAALRRVVETPFDLEKGPLLRTERLRLGEHDHLLVLTAHHIVCDGWSWGVIVSDLAALYRGAGAALPPADSFGDFALAQAALPGTDAHRADEAYWLARFGGPAPSLDLPTDRPRPRRRTFTSRREDRMLDAALIAEVKSLGAKRRASLYATLLSAFGVLLQRLSGQDDVVIGIPAAGQAGGGHHALVGHCVNVLPLRAAIDPAAPFADILDRVRGDLLDSFDHQQYTLGTLLRRLALARDASRLPLVSVLFNLDQALDESSVTFADLGFEFRGNPRTFENFELFINAVQVNGALRLECQYNSDLFHADTVRAWLDAYETLLRSAVADPAVAARDLVLISEPARARLEAFQPARTPYAADRLAHEYFEAQVDLAPTRAAVRDAKTRWSYADLEARANRIAHTLRARGVRRGALVGLSLTRGVDMVAAVLGTLKAGAGYVPLDPAFPAERLAFMAEDAALAALIVDDAAPSSFTFANDRTISLTRDADTILAAPSTRAARDDAAAAPDSVVYVIFTSGSTGKPKGVRVPHRSASNFLTTMQRVPGIGADDRLVSVTTLSFDIAFMELMLPLSAGAEIVIAGHDDVRDGAALRKLVEQSAATMMQATPAGWRILVDSGWRGHAGFRAVSGGEPLPVDLAEALLQRCGEVWNGYGPTETTVYSTYWRVAEPRNGIFIGRPVGNTSVRVLDAGGALCPLGVPGELYIGGDGVALGYLNRPELDAERFVPDPFGTQPGARRYRTGDRGRWHSDGQIEHLGRLDFQVKVRGYRIELGEIEANLAAAPGVARAVAVAREDRAGDVRLVAYVVAREGASLDETALRTQLKARLPDYMVPQHILLLDAIPLLPNGKIDRKALPAPQRPASAASERIAPRDEREQRVATAMEEILVLPGLGIHDDFFALGGHSLLAAQLTARLNREFGVSLSFRTLFDAPTIAGLASAIGAQLDDRDAIKADPITRRVDQTRAPLSLMQQRLWFLEEMNPGRVTYNAPSAHRLRGHLDEAAFERAFAAMVQRQPVLRTAIRRDGDQLMQVVEPIIDLELFPAEDLSALPVNEREAVLMRRLQELTDTPFDLTRAPLFRARMFRLGTDDHALFFMPHHIIWDGWSFDLLYVELTEAYRAILADRQPTLPALPVSYGDFAEWHARWLEGPQLQAQLAFWRERLTQVGEPRSLPTDKPRRPGMSGEGRTEWIRVPKEQTEAMHSVARSADATLNMTLLALYYVLLHGSTGQRDLVIGTPVRGRNHAEVESVMGYFTNLVPLHVSVNPALPFVDFVREVKRVVIDSFGNPDVPLEYLQRELKVRHGGGALLYQALFSFQDARQRVTDWGGLSHEQILLFQRGATEDLGLWFLENASGMIGGVTYNADILRADTACMLRERYLDLLARVIADARQPIASLTRISDADLAQIKRWNVPATDLPAPACIHALFEAQMDRAPASTAVSVGSWGTSYAEVEQRANRIAACLRRRGVGEHSLVALAAEPGVNRIAAVFGILKAGGACLPLDPSDPPARLKALLADARATALIGDSRLEHALEWPRTRALWFDADAPEIITAPSGRETRQYGDLDAPALALYTPHPSGQPHATRFTHRTIVNLLAGLRRVLDIGDQDRVLGTAGVDTGMSILECLLPLVSGAEFVQASRSEAASGDALSKLVVSSRPSVAFASAEAWQALLAAEGPDHPQPKAVCVGDSPKSELAERIAARGSGLWHALTTDATIIASCARVDSLAAGVDAGATFAMVPIGVVDASDQPCPIGAIGEICVGHVMDPATIALRESVGRTGYRGRWLASGRIEELGRLDRRVSVGGRAVEPAEIETRLQAQPGVDRSVVVARADRAGAMQLEAYVTPTPAGTQTDLAHLRATLAESLPAHAIPARIIALDELPMSANGDADVAALVPPAEAGDGQTSVAADEPATAAERLLAAIWMEVLGVPRVGSGDNFFDLGGHSLLAVAMMTKVEKQTRVRMNLLRVANSTLRALAAELPDAPASIVATPTLGQRMRNLFGLGRRE